jgi:hypothetical protein
MKILATAVPLLAACAACAKAEEAKPAPAPPAGGVRYANNFEKAEPGKVPEDVQATVPTFVVKQDGDNRVLETPGEPLETRGVLFGPAEKAGLCVSARIRGSARGKLAPAFGVGLNGVGGYRLQVAPMRKALEILKDEEVKASVPYAWESGTWTRFRFQSRKVGDAAWTIEGKAWAQGAPEPAGWMVTFPESEEPPPGKSSVCGTPYSDLPIQFDDLEVRAAAAP